MPLPTYQYAVTTLKEFTKTHLQLIARPLGKPMPYQAGQYLLISYPEGSLMPFSIANAPSADHTIELHIRVAPNDLPTEQFIKLVTYTHEITLQGPFGHCEYKEHKGPLIILAAGTGFAPAKAIIEQMAQTNTQQPCYLYWTVKQPEDFYLPELPSLWKKELSHFHYTPICTKERCDKKDNILEAVLTDFDSLTECLVYVFGPVSLALDSIKKFTPFGLNKTQFFTDVL